MDRNNKLDKLNENLEKINSILAKNNISEISEILGNNKKIISKNFFAGISKGVGIGIGVSFISALLAVLLQKIVKLNIPVIGDYIADIMEIVKSSR